MNSNPDKFGLVVFAPKTDKMNRFTVQQGAFFVS